MKIIPYGKQSISEKDIAEVCDVLRSNWLTQGPKVGEFEDALCHLTGAKHCIVVSNGTTALHIACLTLGIAPGDVGLTSPISFMASANCISYCGGKPDFADIRPETLCLSPEMVDEYCKKNPIPKVVIPVDFAGVPADLPDFKRLSEKYGFKTIEDAAHSIGSSYHYKGKEYSCGSCAHTDMAVFSFHPVKTITTGEGGAILTNNNELALQMRRFANHGIERDSKAFVNDSGIDNRKDSNGEYMLWYHEMQTLGINARITDVQCALGLSQLKRLPEFILLRQNLVSAYNKAFEDLSKNDLIMLPPWPANTDPCYHLYPIRLGRNCSTRRNDLFNWLHDKDIYAQIHYIPIYRQPYFKKRWSYKPEKFPETEEYFSRCISLPLFPDLSEEAFTRVVY